MIQDLGSGRLLYILYIFAFDGLVVIVLAFRAFNGLVQYLVGFNDIRFLYRREVMTRGIWMAESRLDETAGRKPCTLLWDVGSEGHGES